MRDAANEKTLWWRPRYFDSGRFVVSVEVLRETAKCLFLPVSTLSGMTERRTAKRGYYRTEAEAIEACRATLETRVGIARRRLESEQGRLDAFEKWLSEKAGSSEP